MRNRDSYCIAINTLRAIALIRPARERRKVYNDFFARCIVEEQFTLLRQLIYNHYFGKDEIRVLEVVLHMLLMSGRFQDTRHITRRLNDPLLRGKWWLRLYNTTGSMRDLKALRRSAKAFASIAREAGMLWVDIAKIAQDPAALYIARCIAAGLQEGGQAQPYVQIRDAIRRVRDRHPALRVEEAIRVGAFPEERHMNAAFAILERAAGSESDADVRGRLATNIERLRLQFRDALLSPANQPRGARMVH